MNKPDWEAIESAYREKGCPEITFSHFKKSGEAFLSGVIKIILLSEKPHVKLFDGLVPPIIHINPEFNVPRGNV